MAREVLGTCTCPECGGAAEVKRTKSGLAYRWCMDCNAQYFPRCERTSLRLLEKCGIQPQPKPVREREEAPAPDTVPVSEPKPEPKAAPVPKPQPAPAKAGPFDHWLKEAAA